MRHVFLSYCHDDADFAQILREQLRRAGFATWKDVDLRAGDHWPSEIEQAIREALAVVVVMSARGRVSEYVSFEWAFALGAGVPVLPILLKEKPGELHPRLGTLQTLDFSNYLLRPWDALTQALGKIKEAERPFSIQVPRDAPPVIREAARNLDSLVAAEREAAIETLAQITHPLARDVLVEAMKHSIQDVRLRAAVALAEAKDPRAIAGLFAGIRDKKFDEVNAAPDLAVFGESGVPALLAALSDPQEDVYVRIRSAYALSQLRNQDAIPLLRNLREAPEVELRKVAVEALAQYENSRAWLMEFLQDDNAWVLATAIQRLKGWRGTEIVAELNRLVSHPDTAVRSAAADNLIEVGDVSSIPALLQRLYDNESYIRHRAAKALTQIADPAAQPGLLKAFFDDPQNFGSVIIVDAIVKTGGADVVVPRLLDALHSKDSEQREKATSALGHMGDPAAVPGLLAVLSQDPVEMVRWRAARALEKIQDLSAVPGLLAIVKSDDEEDDLRQAAADALVAIGTPEARSAAKSWERQKKRGAGA